MDNSGDRTNNRDTQAAKRLKLHGEYQKYLAVAHLHMINASYYFRYLHKVPCFDDEETGYVWMMKVLENSQSDVLCLIHFRMECHVFYALCEELEDKYGLRPSKNMTTIEKLGIFLFTLAGGESNRKTCSRFQRSGETVSRVLHQVLEAMVGRSMNFRGFSRELLRPRDREFTHIPAKISSEERYQVFEGAIGAIDGVHMDACIPKKDQAAYFGRKKTTTFNVMVVCDFDMYFTFISAGWEGSAHDARVLDHALKCVSFNFPHPPPERYYLVDKGYPDRQGYMVPYSRCNYHKSDFGKVPPKNRREGFNRVHSSLRTTIERCFGVMKKRWHILKNMPQYSVETQVDIIISCFGLHNFILDHKRHDTILDGPVEEEEKFRRRNQGTDSDVAGMKDLRDEIANEIWRNKEDWLY